MKWVNKPLGFFSLKRDLHDLTRSSRLLRAITLKKLWDIQKLTFSESFFIDYKIFRTQLHQTNLSNLHVSEIKVI